MSAPPDRPSWHSLALPEVASLLDASERGLSGAEVATRLERFGPNRLPHPPTTAWWQIALRQFRNPLIYILAFAAVLSLLTAHFTDAAFIVGVLCVNAAIGTIQEAKAERSAQALQKLLKIRASVQRDGELVEIDAEEIVPGDLVCLESGNRIPADIRLLDSHGLEVNESLLTGESLPVSKDPAALPTAETPVANRLNMIHAGTIVVRGRARGLVANTGTATAVGQLALDVLGAPRVKPPLIVRMERFTRAIGIVIVAAAVLIALLGIFVRGQDVTQTILFAVALIVAAIPEGLPIAMTVALAVATTRMGRRNVIVRRLTAVEGLGSCTLVATDKTGTLTGNELTVREIRLADGSIFEVTGEGFVPEGEVLHDGKPVSPEKKKTLEGWARAAVLCNEGDLHQRDGSWSWHGDPVDLAFLAAGHKLGRSPAQLLKERPKVNEIVYEPERSFAATYHQKPDGETLLEVKGAPERVIEMCRLTGSEQSRFIATAEEMAEKGYRVLALAEGTLPHKLTPEDSPPEPANLTFLGFAGMIDPLRPEAREAVRSCLDAGVSVCMVTGDHRITALAIARDLGFGTSEKDVMTGAEVAKASAEELQEAIGRVTVFARVAPHQKLQIVEAARRSGHFVAVTGDGVNDAPALRSAHIGVAMGRAGTDVAREASDLVIGDDNFATIVGGIEEGRIAYDNIRNVIYLLISTGAAEIVLVALAILFGTPLPLLPVQLLWLNLVTQGTQDWALAFEPGDKDVLKRQPRPPSQPIFDRLMIERTIVAAVVMGGIGFAVFYSLLPSDFTLAQVAAAQNALLLLMVLFVNVHIGNCRSETRSAFARSPFRSPILLAGVLTAFLLHLLSMHFPPMQKLLGTAPVAWHQWIWLVALALTIAISMEFHKLSWWWRDRRRAPENAHS